MTREELRDAAIESIHNCNNLAIQAGTGVGKSKVALEVCNDIAQRRFYDLKTLIVVAEVAHIDNWNAEISKWGLLIGEVTIVCYASLKKYKDTEWDIVIFDEAHHLDSEIRLDALSSIKSEYRIFLSATLKDSFIDTLQGIIGPIQSIKLSLQEAFDADILAKPKIFLIPLTLNCKAVTETVIEEWGKKEKRLSATCNYAERWNYIKAKKQVPNGILTIKCTEQQKYDYLTKEFEYYRKRYISCRNEAVKNKWLQCGAKRKRYLGLLKTQVAKKLLSSLEGKRYICFCTNIEQAAYLGGENAIHSQRKDSLDVIHDFNTKKIDNIFAVGMLQEGQNLVDIQAGVIIQLDGEERAFIQKFGRALRSNSPEQYIMYYKGTRDEEYLNKALENIDKAYIRVINPDEICN